MMCPHVEAWKVGAPANVPGNLLGTSGLAGGTLRVARSRHPPFPQDPPHGVAAASGTLYQEGGEADRGQSTPPVLLSFAFPRVADPSSLCLNSGRSPDSEGNKAYVLFEQGCCLPAKQLTVLILSGQS